MKIPAGPWLPDQPIFANPGLVDVRNAIPAGTHYRPLPALERVAEQAFPMPAQGLFVARRSNGDLIQVYGGGDRLWHVPGRTAYLEDITRGGYAGANYQFNPEDRWRGLQYGPFLVLTNFRDQIQIMNVDAAPLRFENLGGDPPRAKYIAVVRDVVVVAHTFDALDGEDALRVRWHGFIDGLPNLTAWEPSLATQADFRRIANLGQITGLTGGQFGTVLCEHGIVRMTYGADFLFQMDTVETEVGCEVPGSVVKWGQRTYFWGPKGWQRFNGQAVEPIGHGKIDRWFENDFEKGNGHTMWAYAIGEQGVLAWLYGGAGSDEGAPNRLLLYNPAVEQWAVADVEADLLGPAMSFGLDLDDEAAFPDLDTWEGDLDDPRLWASALRTGAVADDQFMVFAGVGMPALFEPGEMELHEGHRTILQRAFVGHEGGTATVRVGKREHQGVARAWSGVHPRQPDGFYRFREPARLHTVRVNLNGPWRRMQYLDVFGVRLGRR